MGYRCLVRRFLDPHPYPGPLVVFLHFPLPPARAGEDTNWPIEQKQIAKTCSREVGIGKSGVQHIGWQANVQSRKKMPRTGTIMENTEFTSKNELQIYCLERRHGEQKQAQVSGYTSMHISGVIPGLQKERTYCYVSV